MNNVVDFSDYKFHREIFKRDDTLIVERRPDRDFPNRTLHFIHAKTADGVQAYINSLIAECESFASGSVEAIGPSRTPFGYGAVAVCIVRPDYG